MDILLIWPPFIYSKYGGGKQFLPSGLGYIASYIRQQCPQAKVELMDIALEGLSFKQAIERATAQKYDMIGLSFLTIQASYSFELSKAIKRRHPEGLLVHGGWHPTASAEECLNYADVCVLHEGEKTFVELIDYLEGNKSIEDVKGIAFKADSRVKFNPQQPLIEDLDDIPFPAWDLIPIQKYYEPMHVVGGPSIPVIESRGCPYDCSFCVSPHMWRRRERYRSAKNVIDEIKWIIKSYGINSFHFYGDNLLLKVAFVEEFCDEVLKQNLNIRWCGLTRPEHINANPQILPKMCQAGCVGIEVGIDSADPKSLIAINKGQTASETEQSIVHERDSGLTPIFTHMLFNPEETLEGYYQQQKLFDRNSLAPDTILAGQMATPYQKTKFWTDAANQGLVLAEEWEEYHHGFVPFVPNSLLEDLPSRTRRKMRWGDYALLILHYMRYRIDLFPKSQGRIERLINILKLRRLFASFYSQCDGELTVREIGQQLSEEFGLSFREGIKFVAFASVIAAKMGLIKGATSQEKIEPVSWSKKAKAMFLWEIFIVQLSLFPSRPLEAIWSRYKSRAQRRQNKV